MFERVREWFSYMLNAHPHIILVPLWAILANAMILLYAIVVY